MLKRIAVPVLLLFMGVICSLHAQDCVGGIITCPDGTQNLCIVGCLAPPPGPLNCPGDCGCPGHMCGGIKPNLARSVAPAAAIASDRSGKVAIMSNLLARLSIVLPASLLPPPLELKKHGPSLPPDPWDVKASSSLE